MLASLNLDEKLSFDPLNELFGLNNPFVGVEQDQDGAA
jgi:hypothetical protein